jgi:uridine kinase
MESDLDGLLDSIRTSAPRSSSLARIVAIDGCAGAGKSTLARRLAAGLDGAPIVHTDDFASWDNQFGWWPRLLEQVILPLARGTVARYRRFDWDRHQLAGWIELPSRPETVIIEGVSAMRQDFDPYLAYRIWVDTPPSVRLQRGLERDGEAMRVQWEQWMAAEDVYVERDRPIERADVVLPGTSSGPADFAP